METPLMMMIGPVEVVIILLVFGCFVALVVGMVVLAVWWTNRERKPPLVGGQKDSPSARREGERCPSCGQPVGADAPHGLCGRCVLAAGFDTALEGGAGRQAKPPPPSCEEVARRFPHFEVLELIGHGGMGAVYKVRQKDLDRVVALKVLPPVVGADPAFARRFASEARALARISHPNIVGIHEFGESGGFYFFVMEYVDGMSLRQLLRTRRLKPVEALNLVPQICEALQHAHNQGIVHRDIKPENILVDKQGRIRIADFGLARLLGVEMDAERITQERDVMGTPQYMAPEQTEHPRDVDHRADIFSLGVVFYEMLTGELPVGRFPAPSQRVVQLDVRLDEVVLRALEPDPKRRYQQANEVKTQIENITHGEGVPGRSALFRHGRAEALRQIKIPALGLVISSLLGPFMVGFMVAAGILDGGAWMFWPLVIQLTLTALAAYGGLKALKLEAHRSAVVGGIAGCIVSFLNLFCLPFAIWFLAVLTRPDVKRAFMETGTARA